MLGLVAVSYGLVQQQDRLRQALSEWMPVRFVRVQGDFANIDPERVADRLRAEWEGGYLLLNLGRIERSLSLMPWIETVRVSRTWPDTVVLELQEQHPVARWGHDGLISQNGRVLDLSPQTEGFSHLPRLYGPPGREAEALALLTRLNEKWSARGATVVDLVLSDRLACVIELSDGLKIAYGSQEPLAATDRLLSLLPKLGEKGLAGIRTIDLRYPRGFAVTWRPAAGSDAHPDAPEAG